ncbi:MAG: MFS transporter [Candidatus Falkowbacteria bacterium]
MQKRKKTEFKKRLSLLILYFLGFLLAISSALPAYIQSNFLNEFVSLRTLSVFFIIANSLTVFCIVAFPKYIKILSNFFLTKVILVIHGVSLLALVVTNNPLSAFLSIALFTISTNLLWINMDVLIETFSSNSSTGRTRTTYFTFINLGWIIAPSLSSYLIKFGDYQLAFLIAASITIPVFFVFLYQGRRLKDKVAYSKEKLSAVIKKSWNNKNLRGIFFISLILQLFYSTAVVYVPIYLYQNLGISWQSLGLMFSIMLIPFLLFEIPAGIIADKYIGEKEILFLGLFILVCSLFLFFYIQVTTFWIWASVLFLSRVGASLIEAMRETYFFKIVSAKDVVHINIFRTTSPLGYVIGSGLAVLILSIFPLNYLFLIVAIISLSGFAFIASIKDTK